MRPTIMRVHLLWLVCLVVAVVSVGAGSAHADALKVGDRLAELDVAVDANGKSFKLKALKGKWLVLTIGASWCPPCAKELPAWDRIAGELKDKVVFIALNIDDDIEVGKRFHNKLKVKHMQRVYMPSEKSAVVASYGSDAMPTTFVADDKGVVRLVRARFEEGDPDGEYRKFKDALTKLLPRS
jgi:thiol-disulfide isomerase/thioredoxin